MLTICKQTSALQSGLFYPDLSIFTKTVFMQVQIQEGQAELFEYWQKLTSVQKDLVLNLIKNIVREELEEPTLAPIPKEIMDGIWKDREDHMNGVGKTYSREEAREYILRNAAKNEL